MSGIIICQGCKTKMPPDVRSKIDPRFCVNCEPGADHSVLGAPPRDPMDAVSDYLRAHPEKDPL